MKLCGKLTPDVKKVVGGKTVYDVTCPPRTEGKFVKIIKPDNGYQLRICEIQVYGYFV